MRKKWVDLHEVLKLRTTYSVVMGKRGPGKTWSAFEIMMEDHVKTGSVGAYCRRWYEDIKTREMGSLVGKMTSEGFVKKVTRGEWDGAIFFQGGFYLTKEDPDHPDEPLRDKDPFARTFCLSKQEHYKSSGYAKQGKIVFDEFIPMAGGGGYIAEEFKAWNNLISTLTRDRPDIQIIMLANTIDRYCPYFDEMGLKHVKDQQPGTTEIYRYSDPKLTVAVEYTDPTLGSTETSHYFAFDNPSLRMITEGTWEIGFYPTLPRRYQPSEVAGVAYLSFKGRTAACEVIAGNDGWWLYWRPHTKKIPSDAYVIFDHEPNPDRRYLRKIGEVNSELSDVVGRLMESGKVFYQSNDVGYLVESYMKAA